MRVAIWDTYENKKDGGVMHFDILVPADNNDENEIFSLGKSYLENKGQALAANECKFCHIENATAEVINKIEKHGFSIIEIEGCN